MTRRAGCRRRRRSTTSPCPRVAILRRRRGVLVRHAEDLIGGGGGRRRVPAHEGERVSQQTPTMPALRCVPTTGPISVTIIGGRCRSPSGARRRCRGRPRRRRRRRASRRARPPRCAWRGASSARPGSLPAASTTRPSRTVRIGFNAQHRAEERLRAAQPSGLDEVVHRVDRAHEVGVGDAGRGVDATSAAKAPDSASVAASRARSPSAAVTVRESTTRTSMASFTASAPSTADW